MGGAFEAAATGRRRTLRDYADGPLAAFVVEPATEIERADTIVPDGSATTLLAAHRLEFEADYRGAIQRWFRAVAPGGHLLLVVSHAFLFERQLALPSRWFPAQRRLYSPRSLLEEVEEALAPNSYRVRYLGDDDRGYDYAAPSEVEPGGHADILLALEKIVAPAWSLAAPVEVKAPAPDYGFEPDRTRVEVIAFPPRRRVLVMKLDHLGDFVMSLPALRRAREAFAGSELTLVVGSWNADMARQLDLADHVVAFDAFPRNSSEEEVDVPGKAALFRAALPGEYDVAIDLRTDHDTRVLLRNVKASIRAGIGTRSWFPFLDIFLPIDATRNEPETAREFEINHHAFASQAPVRRGDHRVFSPAAEVERHCAIVWGPYRRLRTGRYVFEPFVELARDTGGGVLKLDVALDTKPAAELMLPAGGRPRLRFEVEKPDAEFEFRIWAVDDEPSIDFSFFGGRLIREGAASVLHQSEYQMLLIELVRMRLERSGVLSDALG